MTQNELRGILFSDLFYKIYENEDGLFITKSIIHNIDSQIFDKINKNRKDARQLYIDKPVFLKSLYDSDSSQQLSNPSLQHLYERKAVLTFNKQLQKLTTPISSRNLYTRTTDIELESIEREINSIKDSAEQSRREKLDAYDKKTLSVACTELDRDKIIKSLYLLPHIDNDQELIIFFGNNFHATFSNIDAYTGLLYTAEFFDFEENIMKQVLLAPPVLE